jgi:dTDP-glucose pyrophosphorylase
MTAALIMAGGRSDRMRATLGSRHKALVPVLGVPMLERNLHKLLSAGFRTIVVASSAREPTIGEYVRTRGRALARTQHATVESVVEDQPRGTIGIAGVLHDRADAWLVVNVDNLTALDLQALALHHRNAGAALTIATHVEPFRIPFGELEVSGTHVVRYAEKSLRQIRVSSGAYVLSPRACRLIRTDGRTDVPELVEALLARGESIAAFEHEAPWIDVNDAAAVTRAEELIARHPSAFDYWARPPDCLVVSLMVTTRRHALLEMRPGPVARYAGLWDVPGEQHEPTDGAPLEAVVRKLQEELGGPALRPQLLISFDDVDPASERLIRHHVFTASSDRVWPIRAPNRALEWTLLSEEDQSPRVSPVASRSIAALRRRA